MFKLVTNQFVISKHQRYTQKLLYHQFSKINKLNFKLAFKDLKILIQTSIFKKSKDTLGKHK